MKVPESDLWPGCSEFCSVESVSQRLRICKRAKIVAQFPQGKVVENV